jgi:hypothetical protein
MKTARRQELRTNELSQQLDQISVYVKQNVAMLTIVIAVAAIVTAGGFWFVKSKQNQVMDGWAMLNDSEVLKDMSSAVGQFRTLAEEHRSPALTLAAWLRIGEIAMAKVANPETSTAIGSSGPNWSETALNAFSRVENDYPNDVSALGQAYISLGVLAENKSDNEKARQYYQKVVNDARFAGTPFVVQAKFRLEGLPIVDAVVSPLGHCPRPGDYSTDAEQPAYAHDAADVRPRGRRPDCPHVASAAETGDYATQGLNHPGTLAS